jgi:hypothetical protein
LLGQTNGAHASEPIGAFPCAKHFFDPAANRLGHKLLCRILDFIHRTMSDFAIHPAASIIGETESILSRTRAALAPAKPVLRILDRIDPLAKFAVMR